MTEQTVINLNGFNIRSYPRIKNEKTFLKISINSPDLEQGEALLGKIKEWIK
jgi:hypothetical protein